MSETNGEGVAAETLEFSFEGVGWRPFEKIRPPQPLTRLTLPEGGWLKVQAIFAVEPFVRAGFWLYVFSSPSTVGTTQTLSSD